MQRSRILPALLAPCVVFGLACGASDARRGIPPSAEPAAPRVLVVASLDGFRWDYVRRGLTPHLTALAARGVTTRKMLPSFPTKTFPNHYTIATGLYPGHHGIVANTMWDAELGGFSMANREAVKDARWWGGEPIWVTAERQGLATAPLFWPGSEAPIHGHLASEWRPWDDGKTDVAGRLAWVLERLARPAAERPRFLTFYTEVVDDAGHHNPNASVAVDSAITRADAAIGELVAGIERLGLRDVVDLVVVADHGMAETSPERTIYLDDLVPLDALRVIDWNPLLQAAPKAGVDVDDLVRRLRASPHLAVYRKSETPLDWHYRDAPRVPEILALADEGWSLTTHDYVAKHPLEAGGNHGYDRNLESMGALFVAAGPSFRQGVEIAPFENVDLYEMFCKILGLTPAPNDGQFERVRGALR